MDLAQATGNRPRAGEALEVERYKVVRPEHLNHFGYLFGGCLLKWVDEIAWIAASRDHPGCSCVTVAVTPLACLLWSLSWIQELTS